MKNYSATWANGSANQRTSNVLDHAGSDAHKAAMSRLYTAQARARNEDITTYAPIARSMLTLQEAEQDRMRKKFDLCYFLAKEGLAFEKFPALCDLEVKVVASQAQLPCTIYKPGSATSVSVSF